MSQNNQNTKSDFEEREVFGKRSVNPSAKSESSKRVEVRVNSDAAKRRLGRDIYTTRQRAFEEMTGNAFTGIEEAVENEYITADEGLLHIQAFPSRGDQYCLRVIDNGIGMTESVVRDVFCEFGVTTHGSDQTKMGQFGMGVASYPNLVGFDDGMLYVETHSRRNGDAIAGRFTIDDFVYETGEDELQLLGADEYGTAVEAWLIESITLSDIKEWVEELAEENPLPILFQYETKRGQQEKEEYSVTPIKDRINSRTPHLYFENEVVEVACGLGVEDKTVLLHKDIEWSSRFSNRTMPFRNNVYVRFKTESVQEVEGDQALVVTEAEYDAKAESVKHKYKTFTQVDEDMPLTPRVVGNREKLVDKNECGEWIMGKIRETLSKELHRIIDSINTVNDYTSLRQRDRQLFDMALRGRIAGVRKFEYKNYDRGEVSIGTTPARAKNYFGNNYGVELTDEKAKLLTAMFGDDFVKETKLGYEFENARRKLDTDVYIGCSIDNKKRKVVEDHDPHTIVKKVESANVYEKYQEAFGWKLLKNVTKSRLDEFNISDKTRKLWTNEAKDASETKTGVEIPNESLTIHYGRNQRKKKKASAKYVYNTYYEGQSLYGGQGLVLFTPDSEHNLSGFYEYIEGEQFGIANASKKVAETLSDLDNVYTIDSVIAVHREYQTPTTKGYLPLGEVYETETIMPIVISNDEYEALWEVTDDEIDMVTRLGTLIEKRDSLLAEYEGEFTDVALLKADAVLQHKFALVGVPNRIVSTSSGRSDGLRSLPLNIGYSYKNRLNFNVLSLSYAVGLCEYADTEAYEMFRAAVQNSENGIRLIKYLQERFAEGNVTLPE